MKRKWIAGLLSGILIGSSFLSLRLQAPRPMLRLRERCPYLSRRFIPMTGRISKRSTARVGPICSNMLRFIIIRGADLD